MRRLVLLLASSLMVSCAAYSPMGWGWREWVGPDVGTVENGPVVTLEWSKRPGVIALIDEGSVGAGFDKAKLSPGRHVIEYAYYPVEFGAHPKGTIDIDLTPGHSYDSGSNFASGACRESMRYGWMTRRAGRRCGASALTGLPGICRTFGRAGIPAGPEWIRARRLPHVSALSG